MNDRELLELAAKAADILALPFHGDTDGKLYLSNMREWNPLTDDGDALRLAVKLGLTVDCSMHCAGRSGEHQAMWVDGLMGDCELTRRAIVRAAAEIGRNME